MYCEGGRSRTGELQERARRGIGRLVLETGVPVVPVAIVGSAKIRNWKRLRFPAVTVEYGRPLHFDAEQPSGRERQQEIADAIFAEIRAMYERRLDAGHATRRARRREARELRRADSSLDE
jgi:1-acyl-sn-glycerol-3-phosphate acyltransferase